MLNGTDRKGWENAELAALPGRCGAPLSPSCTRCPRIQTTLLFIGGQERSMKTPPKNHLQLNKDIILEI